jgi:hypothetical protein
MFIHPGGGFYWLFVMLVVGILCCQCLRWFVDGHREIGEIRRGGVALSFRELFCGSDRMFYAYLGEHVQVTGLEGK